MFRILAEGARLCDGLTRRDWLRVGGLGVAGLSLPSLLRAREAAPVGATFGRAKACIVLFLAGGPPQHETWDPKADAPAEVRGPLKPIASSVPGLHVGELMPRTARLAHRVAVLRAVSTNDNAHSSSGYWMLTGYPHQPLNVENAKPGSPNDWPCVAAVVRKLRPAVGSGDPRPAPLPAAITLPEHIWNTGRLDWPGQNGGWLGRTADPWLLTCNPNAPGFRLPGLDLPAEVPPLRFDGRLSLLDQINRHLDAAERADTFGRHDSLSRQAFDLLRSPAARRAFDLEREPAAVRDRYGRHRFGQSVLLARRLVEAGARLVQVNWTRDPDGNDQSPMWDTHQKNDYYLKAKLMPPMDAAYSALLDDLHGRGLLDSTLVVWCGEFGRTPKLNPSGGRDHWGHVFSCALAGAGVRGGVVHGASDRIGAFPKDGRVPPQDLTATIFHALGIPPETEIQDPLGRRQPISRGDVIASVF